MTRIYKQTVAFIGLLFTAGTTMAQAPQGIPYQAVARSSSGVILVSQPISVRFTIHGATPAGATLYQETFTPTTTAQGLFSVNVGTGTVVSGAFNGIDWSAGAKFLQVEMDPTGGSSYVDMGTQQMMSVPYALYSNNGVPAGTATGDMLYWNGSSWVRVSVGSNGQVLTLNGGVPTWTTPVLNLSIGMVYGGGIIVYILQPGDPGYDPLLQHGLIAAIADQSTGAQWGCEGTTIGGTGTAIGTGAANTAAILAVCTTPGIAAQLCHAYNGGGYTDWYLPSLDEFNKIYINHALLSGLGNQAYWTSSEAGSVQAWFEDPIDGSQFNGYVKSSAFPVRAVRSF